MAILKKRILAVALFLIAAAGGGWLHAAEDPVKQAYARLDRMRYDEAAALFEQALAAHPAQEGLRIGLAYAYFMSNQPEKALAILDAEAARDPGDLKALVLKSCILYVSGREAAAEAAARGLRSALEVRSKDISRRAEKKLIDGLSPNAGLPAFILGLSAVKRGDAEAAEVFFTEAHRLGYDPAACWLEAVRAELEAGTLAEARRLWDSGGDLAYAWATRPKAPQAAPPRAGPFKPRLVVGLATPRKTPLPDIPAESYLLESFLLDKEGKAAEAAASLKRAASLAPFDTGVLREAAGAWLERAEYGEAVRLLTRIQRLDPLDAAAGSLIEEATARRQKPAVNRATAFERTAAGLGRVRYRNVLAGDAAKVADEINLEALTLVKAGRLNEAADFLRNFTAVYQGSPTLYYNLGQVANTLGRYAEAGTCALKAIGLKADLRDAYDLAGNVSFKAKDFRLSQAYYAAAARISPEDPMASYNLGCACYELDDAAGAEKNWRRAIELEKASPGRGPARREAKPGEVRFDVRVDIEPVSAPACLNLGTLFSRQGRYEEAFDYFKRAAAFNPALAAPHLEMGKHYLRLNEPDKAEACFRKYLDLGGDRKKLEAARLEGRSGQP